MKGIEDIIEEFNSELFQEMSKIPPQPSAEINLQLDQLVGDSEGTHIEDKISHKRAVASSAMHPVELEVDHGWVTSDAFLPEANHVYIGSEKKECRDTREMGSVLEQNDEDTHIVKSDSFIPNLSTPDGRSSLGFNDESVKKCPLRDHNLADAKNSMTGEDNSKSSLQHRKWNLNPNILSESGEWNLNAFHQPFTTNED